MRRIHLPFLALVGVMALGLLTAPGDAHADDRGDDGDVRVEQACTARSIMRVRVRERDDGLLRIDLTVRTTRRGAAWGIVVVHERRLARRARSRTRLSSGSFSRRFTVADWPGRDTIVVRAIGPGGEVCRASLPIDGD